MLIFRGLQLLVQPRAGWAAIKSKDYSATLAFFGHTVLFAFIPPVCGYLGTTRTGWSFGLDRPVRLAEESALEISVLYYFALLVATLSVAWAIHWMANTYGARRSFATAMVLATMTATPLFLVGFAALIPELWLNLVLGLPALAWTVALFYSGVPIMLDIPEERGFLLASAVMGFGLVALVAMIIVTVLLWGHGFAPTFVS
jgi:hypothetical protein